MTMNTDKLVSTIAELANIVFRPKESLLLPAASYFVQPGLSRILVAKEKLWTLVNLIVNSVLPLESDSQGIAESSAYKIAVNLMSQVPELDLERIGVIRKYLFLVMESFEGASNVTYVLHNFHDHGSNNCAALC